MNVEPAKIRAAYAACRRLARRHYENFPTASYLVPRDKRDALAAVYAFARCADDLADEPGIEGRLEQLAEWRQKLVECYVGKAEQPVFIALRDTIERFRLSQENFENLLRAFESDVRANRHANFLSLLAYCSCSANPVGRLVLELFDHREPELFILSDHICTALQLTNFWQDVAVDLERDRIYLPLEDLARFDCPVDRLRAGIVSPPVRALLAFECQRARAFYRSAEALLASTNRRRLVAARIMGAIYFAILERIERRGYDVFSEVVRVPRRRRALIAAGTWAKTIAGL